LDLSYNYVQVRGGAALAKMLTCCCGDGKTVGGNNRTLIRLEMTGNLMNDKVVPIFRGMLATNETLVAFEFERNMFRDEYMRSVVGMWGRKVHERREAERLAKDVGLSSDAKIRLKIKSLSAKKTDAGPSLKMIQNQATKSELSKFFGVPPPGHAPLLSINPLQGKLVGRHYSPGKVPFKGDFRIKLAKLPVYSPGYVEQPWQGVQRVTTADYEGKSVRLGEVGSPGSGLESFFDDAYCGEGDKRAFDKRVEESLSLYCASPKNRDSPLKRTALFSHTSGGVGGGNTSPYGSGGGLKKSPYKGKGAGTRMKNKSPHRIPKMGTTM